MHHVSIQELLHIGNVQHFTKFPADFFERADHFEPETFIQVQTGIAAVSRSGDQRVKSQLSSFVDDRLL